MTTSQPVAPSPEIQLLDLEKRFREVRAVDGVTLEVATGEFFSLLGPSGCGKTTTLRMIGGFELPTAGRILLRGRDITYHPQLYPLILDMQRAHGSRQGRHAKGKVAPFESWAGCSPDKSPSSPSSL